jgi:hypothetical protein
VLVLTVVVVMVVVVVVPVVLLPRRHGVRRRVLLPPVPRPVHLDLLPPALLAAERRVTSARSKNLKFPPATESLLGEEDERNDNGRACT